MNGNKAYLQLILNPFILILIILLIFSFIPISEILIVNMGIPSHEETYTAIKKIPLLPYIFKDEILAVRIEGSAQRFSPAVDVNLTLIYSDTKKKLFTIQKVNTFHTYIEIKYYAFPFIYDKSNDFINISARSVNSQDEVFFIGKK